MKIGNVCVETGLDCFFDSNINNKKLTALSYEILTLKKKACGIIENLNKNLNKN